MRLLFLGDMVGRSGRAIVYDKLPGLIADHAIDFVIVNGENAAGGFGVTEQILTDTLDAGADVMTTGNHVWDQREALVFADRHAGFLRPANYPDGTPGRGMGVYEARNGARVMVSNIMGRVCMAPDLDDPFMAAERQLENVRLGHDFDCVVFDFHAEATSEKVCFAHFVDGRASLVVGTHTHVPTADERILPQGTAYITDVGMTGPLDSVIGMAKGPVIDRFLTGLPTEHRLSSERPAVCGVHIDIDDATGSARSIRRVVREAAR